MSVTKDSSTHSVQAETREGLSSAEKKAGFYLGEDGEWIPDGWVNKKVSELAAVIDSLHKTPKYSDDGLPMVRVVNVKREGLDLTNSLKVSEEVFNEFNKRHTPESGDIVFTRVGSYGNVAMTRDGQRYCLGQNTAIICPQESAGFLFYFLSSPLGKEQIELRVAGSTQKTVSINSINNFELLTPPLPEQKAIAAVLGSLDDKIELLREQNETLETLAQTLFKRWFIDFNFPDENGNPYKDSGGKMIPSELGEIPEEWSGEGLTSYLDVMGGGTPKTSVPEYWNGEYYFFTPKDAKSGFYCISTEKSVTQSGIDNSSTKLFPEDTIFVTARGTVGKTSLALLPMTMNQSCYALKEKNSHNFTGFLLLREAIHKLQKYATGGVFDAITTNTLASTLMAYPSESLVATFEAIVLPIFNKVRTNTQQIQTLTNLRDTLLPKLMKGEIRISL